VFGTKGHSLVFRPARPSRGGLFLEYQEASGEILTPELFPRADGTTWVCAVSSDALLPIDPAHVVCRRRRACATGGDVPNHLAGPREAAIVARQACFRRSPRDGCR